MLQISVEKLASGTYPILPGWQLAYCIKITN